MKKHLIAAAVAGAFAVPATAQVTVYGVLSSGYQSQETKVTLAGDTYARKESSFGAQGLQAGSRLGFRGTEDLGGGMKADVVYELRADLNTGVSDSASGTTNARSNSTRQAFVALSGGFGQVRLGRGNAISKDVYDTYHAHGGSGFAPGNQSAALSAIYIYGNDLSGGLQSVDVSGYGNVRHNNAVTYISPRINGFTLSAQYVKDKSDNRQTTITGSAQTAGWPDAETSASNFGVRYDAGPLSIGIAMDRVKSEGRVAATSLFSNVGLKDSTDIVGVTYDFGKAKVFLTHTRHKDEFFTDSTTQVAVGEVKVDDNSVGLSVPMGAITLIGSYSDGEVSASGTGVVVTEKAQTRGYQLGANYSLSKRTMALVRFGESEAKVSGVKGSIDGFGIGLQHSF